jgi:hypothetical protein
MYLVLCGACARCDSDPPTLTCDSPWISLDPGTCVELTNPCDDHQWTRVDVFRLCDESRGLFVRGQDSPRARFLCADASIGNLIDEPVDFFYARPNETGDGQLRVTIGFTPLSVVASATPSSIPVGGSSQLNASATGGTPPYSYAWTPIGGLSDPSIASPTASPSVTTQYTVVVTDSIGTTTTASVVVNVGLGAVATANPTTIAAGQSSNLDVQASGGTPPYSYDWSPAASLDDATIQSPVASPTTTTQYNVVVSDAIGAQVAATVTVTVTVPNLQACFTLQPLSPISVQADGSCSVGNIVTYNWWPDFLGPNQPPSFSESDPIPPPFLYEISGEHTIRLEVVDAMGNTDVVIVPFTVQ